MSTRTTGALAIAFPVDTPAHLKSSIGALNELCQVGQVNGAGELTQILNSILTALDALAEAGVPTLTTVGTAGAEPYSYRLVPVYPLEFPVGNANNPNGKFLNFMPWAPPAGRNIVQFGGLAGPGRSFTLFTPHVLTDTIGGTFHAGDVLHVTINGTAVNYTVLSGDTNLAGVATSLAAAINTAAIAGISAQASAAVVKIYGPIATITQSVTGGGNTVTQTLSADLGEVPHVGDVIGVTVNGGSAINYTVASGDTTLGILAASVAAAINAAAQTGVTASASGATVLVNGATTLSVAISGSGNVTEVQGYENPYFAIPGSSSDYARHLRGLPGTETSIFTGNAVLTTSNKNQIALPAAPASAVAGFAWDVVKTDGAGNSIGAVAFSAAPSTNVFDDGHLLAPYAFRPHADVGYDATVGVIYRPRMIGAAD